MFATENFSPLGKVTMTEIALFAGTLLTDSERVPFFFTVVAEVAEASEIFFVDPVVDEARTIPLLAKVIAGNSVNAGVGCAELDGSGETDAFGDGVATGDGVGVGVTTGSTGYSDGFNTVITRRGTDPPR